MKQTKKRKRKYYNFTAMTLHSNHGDVVVERCKETKELTFFTPSTIDGERLTMLKEENAARINNFRNGGQR